MEGIIIVNKPKDWTSFDVCHKIRRLTGIKKVGHSGTLDPMATGVLPVFLGGATKFIEQFLGADKAYLGEMTLGIKTDTGDAYGKVRDSNREMGDSNFPPPISNLHIQEIFKKYTGEIDQVPPMYSAIKVNGQRLYRLARKGLEVKREPRKINIYELRLTRDVSPIATATAQRFQFYVLCSKGTYVRQLVMDIGDDLGCGAHLSALERTLSHPFHISQAIDITTIENLAKIGKLDTVVLSVRDFVNG